MRIAIGIVVTTIVAVATAHAINYCGVEAGWLLIFIPAIVGGVFPWTKRVGGKCKDCKYLGEQLKGNIYWCLEPTPSAVMLEGTCKRWKKK